MLTDDDEMRLRVGIFDALDELASRSSFLTRDELMNFTIDGRRIPLVDYSRGIRNPTDFAATLSVVSDPNGPYADHIDPRTGLIEYAFREGDINSGDNRKLREARRLGVPIIVFRKLMPNVYIPITWCRVVAEDSARRLVLIAPDESLAGAFGAPAELALDRRYVSRMVQQRVHQPAFRAAVMRAYTLPSQRGGSSPTCAICRLQHVELLDAAHIVPDRDEDGVASVTNGIALCKIHHAAYDQQFLGISPDYVVHVNSSLLAEVDGPMLKHGIQEMDQRPIELPHRRADRPSRELLDRQFSKFRSSR